MIYAQTLAILCGAIGLQLASADSSSDTWSAQFGTAAADKVAALAVDDETYSDPFIFAGGTTYGSLYATNAGREDVWLMKRFASGLESNPVVWTKQVGSTSTDRLTDIVVTDIGDIIAAGWTYGDFEGQENEGYWDGWVAKYRGTDGELQWATQIGTAGVDFVQSITIDRTTGFVVAAIASSDSDHRLPLDGEGYGGDFHIFIKTLNIATGAVTSTGTLTTEEAHLENENHSDVGVGAGVVGRDIYASSIRSLPGGNLLIAGHTAGKLRSGSSDASSPKVNDIWVAKVSANGNVISDTRFGSASDDYLVAMEIAPDNSAVILCGETYGDMTEGNAASVGAASEGRDVFVTKMNLQTYEILWRHQLSSDGYDGVGGCDIDSDGHVVVSGTTNGAIGDAAAGDMDVFVVKLDGATGEALFKRQLGTVEPDFSNAVGVLRNVDNDIIVGGTTRGNFHDDHIGNIDSVLFRMENDADHSDDIVDGGNGNGGSGDEGSTNEMPQGQQAALAIGVLALFGLTGGGAYIVGKRRGNAYKELDGDHYRAEMKEGYDRYDLEMSAQAPQQAAL